MTRPKLDGVVCKQPNHRVQFNLILSIIIQFKVFPYKGLSGNILHMLAKKVLQVVSSHLPTESLHEYYFLIIEPRVHDIIGECLALNTA